MTGGAGAVPLLLHPSLRTARRALSLATLLVANLLPLIGVAFWGWKLFDLIVIYWLETLVIGGLSIMQLALTTGWFALFAVPFFIVHFGGFMAGHFMFLDLMFGGGGGGDFSAIPRRLRDMIVAEGLWVALISLAVSHGLGFLFAVLLPWLRQRWQGRGLREETEADLAGRAMFGPYRRVMIMHVSILLGAFLATAFGNNFVLLALLVVLKTASDLYLLRREWREEEGAGA